MEKRISELESKFSPDFLESLKTDPMANAIFRTLLRDENQVYSIIEQLCKQRIELIDELTEKITREPMRILLEPTEMAKIVMESNITTRDAKYKPL